MMGPKLQDRYCYGLGVTARHTGCWSEAFRSRTPHDPLDKANRFMRLPASFISAKGGTKRPNMPGDAFWCGVFDASYTQPGDYIAGPAGVFFIASQALLAPVLCVKTNRTISISRPDARSTTSDNSYGGYLKRNVTAVLTGWPASVLTASRFSTPEIALPSGEPTALLEILLPSIIDENPLNGDIIADDLGRSALVIASEASETGWRLVAKIASN